jgi:hypothetical protein
VESYLQEMKTGRARDDGYGEVGCRAIVSQRWW